MVLENITDFQILFLFGIAIGMLVQATMFGVVIYCTMIITKDKLKLKELTTTKVV